DRFLLQHLLEREVAQGGGDLRFQVGGERSALGRDFDRAAGTLAVTRFALLAPFERLLGVFPFLACVGGGACVFALIFVAPLRRRGRRGRSGGALARLARGRSARAADLHDQLASLGRLRARL